MNGTTYIVKKFFGVVAKRQTAPFVLNLANPGTLNRDVRKTRRKTPFWVSFTAGSRGGGSYCVEASPEGYRNSTDCTFRQSAY